MEATSSPPIIGHRRSPDSVGLTPFTTWRNRGRKVRAPNMANPTTKPIALVAVKTRLVKRRQRDDRLGRPALGQHEEHGSEHAPATPGRPSAGEPQG